MKRLVRPLYLGFFSPFIFVAAGEPFEGSGKSSFPLLGFLVSCAALFLYLVTCEYFVGRTERRRSGTVWPTMVAMAAPLVMWFVVMVVAEKRDVVYQQGVPMLLLGLAAIWVGAWIASRRVVIENSVHA